MKLILDQTQTWELLGALFLTLQPAACSSIAAWWYSSLSAPQVIQYDNSTGQIYYSLCNSNSTPVFPANETAALPLDFQNHPPMSGTSVAATGYQADGKYIAALFYQTASSAIAHALLTCNDTGHYYFGEGQGTWDLTTGLDLTVQNQTGLAVLNLVNRDASQSYGFRVYYKDGDGHTLGLAYNPDVQQWYSDGYVSQFPAQGPHISAGFTRQDRVTVITSDGDDFFYVGTTAPGQWNITTFPVTAWYTDNDTLVYPLTNQSDSTNLTKEYGSWELDSFGISRDSATYAKTGFSMDSTAIRSVFYIGDNRDLYQVTENSSYWDTEDSSWVKADRQPSVNWPAADVEYADIGMTFHPDSNQTWIYYVSNGTMTQVYQSSATKWETAIALPKFNDTPATNTTAAGTEDTEANRAGGLSQQAKTGLGVGLGLGLPIILGAIAVYMFYHIKRSRLNREAERMATEAAHLSATSPPTVSVSGMTGPHSSMVSSTAPGYNSGYWEGGYWADGQWIAAHGQPYYTPEGDVRFSQGYYADPNKPLLSPPPPPAIELPIMELRQEMSGDGISEMAVADSPGQQKTDVEEQTNRMTTIEEAQPGSLTAEQAREKTTTEDQPQAK